MATTVEEICPSVEVLTGRASETSIPCPTQGCSKVFHNRSCLRMHLIKTHGVACEDKNIYTPGQGKSRVEKRFYCPVKYCVRGQGTKRHFPRMSQLKQVTHIYNKDQQSTDSFFSSFFFRGGGGGGGGVFLSIL